MTHIDVSYDVENELPVPTAWRKKIGLIVDAFNLPVPADGLEKIENVSFGDRVVEISVGQIADYPASRVFIGPKTWHRSINIWEEGNWSLLVDLHIDDNFDEVSDLVLPVKVKQVGDKFYFEPNFIHVP